MINKNTKESWKLENKTRKCRLPEKPAETVAQIEFIFCFLPLIWFKKRKPKQSLSEAFKQTAFPGELRAQGFFLIEIFGELKR